MVFLFLTFVSSDFQRTRWERQLIYGIETFFLLWQGQLASQIGVQAGLVGMAFWVKRATESVTLVGFAMALLALPSLIVEPIGGAIADRYDRKKIIVLCDLLSGLCTLTLAAILFAFPHTSKVPLISLFILISLVGILQALFRPAIYALIPDLVPRKNLSSANSLNQSSIVIAQLLGNGMGGVLFRVLGAPVLFVIDGITYFISAISESFISVPKKKDQTEPDKIERTKSRYLSDTLEGLRYFWSQPSIRISLITYSFHSFFIAGCSVVLPFFVENHLGAPVDWYGFLVGGFCIGSIGGYLISGALKISPKNRRIGLTTSFLVTSITLLAIGFAQNVWQALLLFFTFGIANSFIQVQFLTLAQTIVPVEKRGRALSILSMVAVGITPFAMGVTGVLADLIGLIGKDVSLVYCLYGTILIIFHLFVQNRKDLHAFMSFDYARNPTFTQAGESTHQ